MNLLYHGSSADLRKQSGVFFHILCFQIFFFKCPQSL
jgi:hypothetical protein